MKSSVSALTKFIVLRVWLFCSNVIVVGSWRLVVVNLIHASVQDTSSSFNESEAVLGGSVVSQLAKPIAITNKKNIIMVFISFKN